MKNEKIDRTDIKEAKLKILKKYHINSIDDLDQYGLISETQKRLSVSDLAILIGEELTSHNILTWLNILINQPEAIDVCPLNIKKNLNKSLYNDYSETIINLVSKQIQFKYLLPNVYKIKKNL